MKNGYKKVIKTKKNNKLLLVFKRSKHYKVLKNQAMEGKEKK